MSIYTPLDRALAQFNRHYSQRLEDCNMQIVKHEHGIRYKVLIHSNTIRRGNHPRIYHHGHPTEHAIVITHGLSDSPYFVKDIANRFYQAGLNVVMPLLPGHGLKNPDNAVQDPNLDKKWRQEISQAVSIASQLGTTVSLAGFSAGGALSYNKVLRSPKLITGGLFLFSAALDLGNIVETSARLFFVQSISKMMDGEFIGNGRNPYKYSSVPSFCGIELTQIIKENDRLSKNIEINIPVFAAHSVDDAVVKLDGLMDLIQNKAKASSLFMVAENVAHAEITLKDDIPLDLSQTGEPKIAPRANPQFELMMDSCIQFYKRMVKNKSTVA